MARPFRRATATPWHNEGSMSADPFTPGIEFDAPLASTGVDLFARIDNETMEQQLLQSGVVRRQSTV